MSRVGKMQVVIPEGTTATIANNEITVKGPLGSMSRILSDLVTVKQEDKSLKVEAANDSREAVAMWGTTRALLNNMVLGVSKGFEKRLNLVGVGFRAQAQGDKLNMSLGFSHPVVHVMPAGVKCETPSQTELTSTWLGKSQLMFVHIANLNHTRARVFVMQTKSLRSKKLRRSNRGD